MRLRIPLTVLLLIITVCVPPPTAATAPSTSVQACSFPVTEVDATETNVTIEQEPQRVVTLAPSAAQIMWEIGAKDKVVGVTQHASYLEGAERKVNVSGTGQSFINIERVVALEPDLVLAPSVTDEQAVQTLRDAGLTVYYYRDATSIEDIYRDTKVTGRLVGECDGAQETINWMKERISTVRQTVKGQERPDVLYLFYGFTAGRGTFVNEIIETAGGTNIAAKVGISGYKQINPEVIVKQNPEVILLNDEDPAVPDTPAYNNITALQKNQTVIVPIEYLNQPAPRAVYAITILAKQLHPQAYAEANATTTRTTVGYPPVSPVKTALSGERTLAHPLRVTEDRTNLSSSYP